MRLTYRQAARWAAPLVLLGNIPATTTHSGSRLLILPDRTLLMTTGDAQQLPEAQNPASLNGKILRLNLDGTVPANNPTPGSLVYTLGHRNPQGLVRAASGRLYSSEHGPNNDDEAQPDRAGPQLRLAQGGRLLQPTRRTRLSAPQQRARAPHRLDAHLGRGGPHATTPRPAIPGWHNHLLLVTLKASRLTDLPLNAAGDP